MALTTEQRLDALRSAMDAFLANGALSSYSVPVPGGGSLTFTKDIDALRRLEDSLVARLAVERATAATGGNVNYFRPGPR